MSAILRGEPNLGKVALDSRASSFAAKALLDGIGEGKTLPDGDRLAMQQPVGIAGIRFERVAERVAEIEQRARAGFLALVAPRRWQPWRARSSRWRGARAGPLPEKTFAQCVSSQAKNGASPSSPYFMTSA